MYQLALLNFARSKFEGTSHKTYGTKKTRVGVRCVLNNVSFRRWRHTEKKLVQTWIQARPTQTHLPTTML